jgi:hypothetical protein
MRDKNGAHFYTFQTKVPRVSNRSIWSPCSQMMESVIHIKVFFPLLICTYVSLFALLAKNQEGTFCETKNNLLCGNHEQSIYIIDK